MTHLQIQQELANRLISSRDAVELRTEEGVLVGYFVPAQEGDQGLWEKARSAFSDEEVERARREPGGSTLQEILQELEDRWPST